MVPCIISNKTNSKSKVLNLHIFLHHYNYYYYEAILSRQSGNGGILQPRESSDMTFCVVQLLVNASSSIPPQHNVIFGKTSVPLPASAFLAHVRDLVHKLRKKHGETV